MGRVPGDLWADEPTEQHYRRNADGSCRMMQPTLRADVRDREFHHRAREPNSVGRHKLDTLQTANVAPANLEKLPRVSIGEFLPAIPEPRFVGVPDSLDVRLNDDAAAVLATELLFDRRECNVCRRWPERFPRPTLDVLLCDVGAKAAAVQRARLRLSKRCRDLLVAGPDNVGSQPAELIDDRDRALHLAGLAGCHQFVAPAHVTQSQSGGSKTNPLRPSSGC